MDCFEESYIVSKAAVQTNTSKPKKRKSMHASSSNSNKCLESPTGDSKGAPRSKTPAMAPKKVVKKPVAPVPEIDMIVQGLGNEHKENVSDLMRF